MLHWLRDWRYAAPPDIWNQHWGMLCKELKSLAENAADVAREHGSNATSRQWDAAICC